MDVKIAVASSDGRTVNEHFGRARSFSIYRLHETGNKLLEVRENNPACSGQQHSDFALEQTVGNIADCRGVVAAQIGAGAIDALIRHRILAFTMSGPIAEALNVLHSSKRFTCLR